MPDFSRSSIRYRFAWSIVATSLVPLVATLIVVVWHVLTLNENLRLRHMDLAKIVAEDVSVQLIENRNAMRAAADALGASDGPEQQLVKRIFSALHNFETLLFISSDQQKSYLQGHVDYLSNLSETNLWCVRESIRDRQTVIGQTFSQNEVNLLPIATPIYNIQNQTGSLLGLVDLSRLVDQIATRRLESFSQLDIYEDSGKQIYSSRKSQTQDLGEDKVFAKFRLETVPWIVVVSSPAEKIFTKERFVVVLSALFISFVLLMTFSTGIRHWRSLGHFFDTLTIAMLQLRQGKTQDDQSKREFSNFPLEMREILLRFAKLADDLTISRKRLLELNRQLEFKVAERTESLRKQNEELLIINALIAPISHLNQKLSNNLKRLAKLLGVKELRLNGDQIKKDQELVEISDLSPSVLVDSESANNLNAKEKNILRRFLAVYDILKENADLLEDSSRNRRFFENMLSVINMPIVVLNEMQIFQYTNPCFKQAFNLNKGQKIDDLITLIGSTKESWDELLLKDTSQQLKCEEKFEGSGFKRIWSITSVSMESPKRDRTDLQINFNGNKSQSHTVDDSPSWKVLLFHDITKDEEVKQIKDDIVALAAHELNNPLSTLGIGLETLLYRDDRLTHSARLSILEQLLQNTKRLQTLIRDWLDISSIQNGAIRLRYEKISVNKLRHSVLSLLSSGSDYVIWDTLPSEMDITFIGDPIRLSQVFVNLIKNGLKYNDSIKPFVKVTVEQNDTLTIFKVSDNGIGFSDRDREHLYERFYRGTRALNLRPSGSGLGLSICHTIIEAHHGKIELISLQNAETKTIFEISLPNTNS